MSEGIKRRIGAVIVGILTLVMWHSSPAVAVGMIAAMIFHIWVLVDRHD